MKIFIVMGDATDSTDRVTTFVDAAYYSEKEANRHIRDKIESRKNADVGMLFYKKFVFYMKEIEVKEGE